MIRRAAVPIAILAAIGATACGVAEEDSAREIEPSRVPYAAFGSPTPAAAQSGAVTVKLFMVNDGRLVAIHRQVRVEPTIDQLVRDLLTGPTQRERDNNVTSALLGVDIVAGVTTQDAEVVVDLRASLDETGRTDEILGLGQIVCTIASRPNVIGVSFTHDGERILVPRADGSLSPGPLTVADYSALITTS